MNLPLPILAALGITGLVGVYMMNKNSTDKDLDEKNEEVLSDTENYLEDIEQKREKKGKVIQKKGVQKTSRQRKGYSVTKKNR
jgi:hypothetical protein